MEFDTVEIDDARFAVDLVCMNPPNHIELFGPTRVGGRRRYTIGFWWWEVLGQLSFAWRPGLALVDEIWVGSEHTARSLEPISPVPVHSVRLPISPGTARRATRAELGLPENAFCFLFMFDYWSTVQRKNPLGLIDAFTRAFPRPGEAVLVMKTTNATQFPTARQAVEDAAAGRPDVVFLDGHLDVATKNALVESCDSYASLHRAEGFGLPLAEAMYFGKPVVATRYSGNLEFMTEENSYLVDCAPVQVREVTDEIYPPRAQWVEPDLEDGARLLRLVFDNQADAATRGRLAREQIHRDFSLARCGALMRERIEYIERNLVALV